MVRAGTSSVVSVREAVKWDTAHLTVLWVTVPSEEKFFLTNRKYGGISPLTEYAELKKYHFRRKEKNAYGNAVQNYRGQLPSGNHGKD
jgi:hypothetical protein